MSDVGFSVKVNIADFNPDIAEKVKREFQEKTYTVGEDTLYSIEEEIEEELNSIDDTAQDMTVAVEVSEYFLSADSDTDFTLADFEGLELHEVHVLLEKEKEHGKAFVLYFQHIGNGFDFEESYAGEYDSPGAFCQELCGEVESSLTDLPGFIYSCIDWEDVWESALRFDYWEDSGHFYRNM